MVELAVVATMIAILAAMAVPVARYSLRRQRELELRHQLRTMREAIDKYKQLSDAGLIPLEIGGEGYPPELEKLVEGVDLVGQVKKKQRFLRQHPGRSHDGQGRVGPALLPGRARLLRVGRPERLRRLFAVGAERRWTGVTTRNGDARHEPPNAGSPCSSFSSS